MADSFPTQTRATAFQSLLQRDSCFVEESEQTWHEIRATESKRRALLKRTGDSFFSILCSYEGTFWRIMTRDLLLWVTMGLYLVLRLTSHFTDNGDDDENAVKPPIISISSNQMAGLGAVMTFFLVYLHSQYSNRFDRFFQNSTGAQGRIFDATTMIKATLPMERGIRIVRYLNSAYILGYVGLSRVYSYQEFLVPLNERYQLLTEEECQRLQQIRHAGFQSDPIREVIAWCVRDVHDALQQGYIDPHTAQDLRHQILRVRGVIADMYDHYEQPLLFIYVHFVVMLTAIYLPLAAVYVSQEVATATPKSWFHDVIGILALLLQCIFVIGIRYIAQVMRVPYAGELESLPVLTYAEDCCDMSLRIMCSDGYQLPDVAVEQELSEGRQTLGEFWDRKDADVSLKQNLPFQGAESAGTHADIEAGCNKH